jgi:HEPN domain-containing protein
MTQGEAATHWRKRARSELKAARILFEKKEPDVYGEVIFHCHLALELAFKARYIQEHDAAAPFTHNLGELAHMLGEEWSERDHMDFDELSDHAVLARYGDEEWYMQHATEESARVWLEKVERFLSRMQP